ncbi:hypothetical protein ACFL3N_00165 [Candidatus Omnitrophota bacterium]
MLLIVMHSKVEYLRRIESLAEKNKITNSMTLERKDIASRLFNEAAEIVFPENDFPDKHDKVFIAVIKDQDKLKQIVELIENDAGLKDLGAKDRGLVYSIPLVKIKEYLRPQK